MRLIDSDEFDIIVLGSGISGTIIGSIVARQGYRVLIFDGGVHPRFAIGESTIPQTSQLFHILSRKYDVPELDIIGLRSPQGLRDSVATTCGVKRVVGFAFHEQGQEHNPDHQHQFGNTWRTENHLHRQDVDAWLLTVAMKYGCHIRQGTNISDIQTSDHGISVTTNTNETFSARYVVDGTGFRSVLADKFDLREQPTSLTHRSRSLFTHVIDVKNLEEVSDSHMSRPFCQGTLHHVFKRGWFWVIPFNNWEGSTNPLVSVGLTVDDQYYPEDPELGPEQEFDKFLGLFPTVARQFEDAKVVRPWIRTKRIQYSSKRAIGNRFALLAAASGFVDPLYSRGLISTAESIESICAALLPALKENDFAIDRFENVDTLEKRSLSFTDRIVHGSYISWDDFDLWNLWVRVWAIGVHITESNLGSRIIMGSASKIKPVENPVFSEWEDPGYKLYFEKSYETITRYERQELTAAQARLELQSILDSYEFKIPLRDRCMGQEWAVKNPNVRNYFLGLKENHDRWVRGEIDPNLRQVE